MINDCWTHDENYDELLWKDQHDNGEIVRGFIRCMRRPTHFNHYSIFGGLTATESACKEKRVSEID